MKRSEMLKKLRDTYGDYDLWSKQCEHMLTILEESGMLPPFSSKAAAKSNLIDGPGFEWEEE